MENILEATNPQNALGRIEVLKDIIFRVGLVKLVGRFVKNGSGKTTLMKSVLGLLNHSGEVYFEGKNLMQKIPMP